MDQELQRALMDLNGNAAVGPERIPSRIIKTVFNSTKSRRVLLALMNSCFVSGRLPSEWGESKVFILYKGKGPRDNPNSYRGINLINDFCRLFKRLLEQRIQTWMKSTDPQGPMQFGFREGVGTQDAFFILSTVARSVVRLKELPYYSCFVYLKKAFPSVLRSKAIFILHKYGAPPNTVRAIEALFSDNSCRLRMNEFISRPFPINRRVKKGGINSPSIFSVVYAEVLSKVNVSVLPSNLADIDPNVVYYFAFAEDLALTCGNLSKLEMILNDLNAVLPEFGMSLNGEKTVWMPFLPTSRFRVPVPDPFRLCLGSVPLSCVDNFVYLGYSMNPFFGSNSHVRARRNLLFSSARSCGRFENLRLQI
jgi:hypothetical protein